MGKVNNILGQRFGMLVVIHDTGVRKNGVIWLCKCDCGNTKTVRACHLTNNATISCGCYTLVDNIVGQIFGRLTVYKSSKKRSGNGAAYWKCVCSCGKTTIARSDGLRNGSIRSCGCMHLDSVSGENNHNWNGGITSDNQKIRKSLKYKKWALSVKAQSNHTCVKCGCADNLVAHHIKSFSANIELRLDIDNGACLCRECHMKFHNKYSYIKFDENDFLSWITGGSW